MIAIRTHYIGPTNYRGSRISAVGHSDGPRVVIDYPDELNGTSAHFEACKALCRRMGWSGTMAAGQLGDGDFVFTFADAKRGDLMELPEVTPAEQEARHAAELAKRKARRTR